MCGDVRGAAGRGRARRVLTGSDDGFHPGPGALGTCQRTGGREMMSLTTFHEDPLSDGLEEGLGRGGGSEGLQAEGREEVIGVQMREDGTSAMAPTVGREGRGRLRDPLGDWACAVCTRHSASPGH